MSKVGNYSNNPLSDSLDIGGLRVNQFSQGVKHLNNTMSQVHPESEALKFYMLNHLAANVLQSKPDHAALSVGEKTLVDLYYKEAATSAVRAIAYLFIIIVREARHCHSGIDYDMWATKEFKVPHYTDSETALLLVTFHKLIRSTSPDTCIGKLDSTDFYDTTMKEFVGFLQYIFYKGSFSSGYGGKAWGAITDVLYNYVVGVASAEITLDTVFTLAHNTGPIFNKGYLYHGQNNSKLTQILDVQRSGQMPELAIAWGGYGTKSCPALLKGIETAIGLGMYSESCTVDWKKVMDLGSVGCYDHLLYKQGGGEGDTPEEKVVKGAEEVGTVNIAGIEHKLLKLIRAEDSPIWSTK